MSNKRITDLTELTTPTTDDVFPVVDIATNTTTKVQLGNLPVPSSVTTALATKQDSLVSGTNIKTINSTSVLGSGNIAVQETLVSGTNIKTLNNTSLLGSGNIVLTANPSGVAGAIQFSNGSAFASDAANFFWDDTNKRLGVGTNAPSSTVHINSNILSNAMFSVGPSFATGFQIFNTNSTGTPVYGIGLNGSYINTRIGFYDTLTFRANGTQIAEMTSSEVRIGSISGARVGIKGSGSTSATTSLLVQNSAGTERIRVFDSNLVRINGGVGNITNGLDVAGGLEIGSSAYLRGLNFMASGLTIGDNAVNFASAILEVKSTTQGFLPPRMTTTQINAIASPANGLEVYNTTLNCPCFYNGTSWRQVTNSAM
jgi:hypothetical protein